MSGLKYYKRTQHILELIEKEKTGPPKQLAKTIGVTERTVYNIIESMRLSLGKIDYSKERKSYIFSDKK